MAQKIKPHLTVHGFTPSVVYAVCPECCRACALRPNVSESYGSWHFAARSLVVGRWRTTRVDKKFGKCLNLFKTASWFVDATLKEIKQPLGQRRFCQLTQ